MFCLFTEAATAAATVVLLIRTRPDGNAVLTFCVLLAAGVVQSEFGRQIERDYRRLTGPPYISMSSVWVFAGVLLLPPALTALLTGGLYLHLSTRSWNRLRQAAPFRSASNATIIALSGFAAHGVLALCDVGGMAAAVSRGWTGALVVAATGVAYFVVNALLVLPAQNVVGRTAQELFGTWGDNRLELATLCLGALNALTLATMPWLVVLVLPPLLILQRTVLVKQLEAAANRDEKTGLLNISGWRVLAERALATAAQRRRRFGLLMIDLDHFKRVNDTYGHLAGDAVLKAVAGAITTAVRDRDDAVGRFGGEEFVVLLPDVAEPDIAPVAERIRQAISRLSVPTEHATVSGLSASIGSASYPRSGTTLPLLLDSADNALYHAKSTGRNKVVHVTDLG
ncbi:diguanylate cyclase [Amycolatopsis sp. NPDC059027]|uniref:GGDEF domain-containing protein n=1 Tax=unclassified Amycolatopsis TaxID=2618356 RepID=UPI00366C74E0